MEYVVPFVSPDKNIEEVDVELSNVVSGEPPAGVYSAE
jgi:hypothetical protein